MALRTSCYCGSASTYSHFLTCSSWKQNSLLYKTVLDNIRQGKSKEFLSLEIEAIKELLLKNSHKPELPESDFLPMLLPEPKQSQNTSAFECVICYETSDELTGFFFPDICFHIQCKWHAVTAIRTQFSTSETVLCPYPECSEQLNPEEIKSLVGPEELEKLQQSLLEGFLKDSQEVFVQCSCGNGSILTPGSVDLTYKDETGKRVSERAAKHMAKYRYRCPACMKIICARCKQDPYHLGFSCEEFKNFTRAKHCIYCNQTITSKKEICADAECKQRYTMACRKPMPCGHKCNGISEETRCIGCIAGSCVADGQTADDYCIICYSEGLSAAPSVRLVCGHILHYHCVLLSLQKRWVGPCITFKFARCPGCNEWTQCFDSPTLMSLTEDILGLYDKIRSMALKRLKFENLDNEDKLLNPKSHYFQKPEAYALDRLTYYECFKCKEPYFGGKKECDVNRDRDSYLPEELVCPSCAAIGVQGRDCHTHGKDYIEFKCKFCCSIACWFCWGNTHFCDECHSKQNNGNYMTKKKREELDVCGGPETCKLKVGHPPNGEEFALGCAICRNLQSNHQQF